MIENLSIGTRSWTNQAWQSFFPEDLPVDWQLDYYSHYFNCVLVPETQWLAWTEQQLIDFAEALEGEGFEFFFELKASFVEQTGKQFTAIKSHFQSMAVGILMIDTAQSLPDQLNDFHVTLFSETESLPGWRWHYNGEVCSGYPLGYVSNLPVEGKMQSSCLQSFMDSLPPDLEKAHFIVADEALAIESVQNLKIIAEVMGF
ncbi:hypothetical protein CYQ88_09660 [Hydrogenovibrio sp. SC-1]|uniref:hypothetical protein n=1 Tax=Hydrogenovibrio sp. SC-1 TaxID=2065820 RepID=UPI000C7E3318|nr:hypothetical protein [Hydrogenovibrio sp. SC-1]PLA73716.1 hypothetical protein CYQ88_09660 [Hydrogenovibrio sp. SC-1]